MDVPEDKPACDHAGAAPSISGAEDGREGRPRGALASTSAPATLVLLVEADLKMQQVVVKYFVEHGVSVTTAADRAQADRCLDQERIDLVVLDLRLGAENGLDLLRDLRTRSDVPVIITTEQRRDEVDRVLGLELGADDYVIKPYGLPELLARVRVILRRTASFALRAENRVSAHRSFFAGWILDRYRRRLTDPAGNDVPLTKGEYALLLAFVDTPQKALTRERLLQVSRLHEDVFDRSIDVQILRLRRKLEVDPSAPRLIITERGVGYVFTPVVTTALR